MYLFKRSLLVLLAGFMAFQFTACEDDEGDDNDKAIKDDEALTIVKTTLTDTVSGVYSQMQFNTYNDFLSFKAAQKPESFGGDTTLNINYSGAHVSFDYTLYYSYELTADMAFELKYGISGTFDGPKVKRTTSDTAEYVITSIQNDPVNLTGSSEHTGDITLKEYDNKSYSYTINYQYSSVSVSKNNNEAGEGSATFTMSGTNPDGVSYELSGSIELLGEGMAELTIRDKTYTINLMTGEVS